MNTPTMEEFMGSVYVQLGWEDAKVEGGLICLRNSSGIWSPISANDTIAQWYYKLQGDSQMAPLWAAGTGIGTWQRTSAQAWLACT